MVIGSPRLLDGLGLMEPVTVAAARARWEQRGLTPVMVGVDGVVAGGFALADTIKASAAAAVAELRRLGLRTVLLTGDTATIARAVAAELGIDEVISEVLPADKAATITALQARGRRVAMVGDGINDAPALARADLGLAVVSGTDVALDAADVVLVAEDLAAIPAAIRLARRTRTTIRGNLAWAFGYNLAALPLAALGLLNPVIAAAAMALSSGFVLANSLRLRRFQPHRSPAAAAASGSDGEPG